MPDFELRCGGLAEALSQADLAITKSGTITLECAFFGIPAVVFYRASWPNYLIARAFVNVDFLAMPNLLAGEAVYPEFIQHHATPVRIAAAALDLLTNNSHRNAVRERLAEIVASLGGRGASHRAAQAILRLLDLSQ
jgi:lipid-A-disaccharide synthase